MIIYCCLFRGKLTWYGNDSSLFWPYGPRYAPISLACPLAGRALLDLGDAGRQWPFCFEFQTTIKHFYSMLLQRQVQRKLCRIWWHGHVVVSAAQIQPTAPYLLVRSMLHAHLHPKRHPAPPDRKIPNIHIVCPFDGQQRFGDNVGVPRRLLAICQRRWPGGYQIYNL